MIKGMNRSTGRSLADSLRIPEHLFQSMHDILTTLIGTRLCRRDYGSLIPELIDQPCNEFTQLKIMNASATALIKFEPRIKISSVMVSQFKTQVGYWEITISGKYQHSNGMQNFQQNMVIGHQT